MSLNNTPSGDRIHIGIFGRRNAGKSSIINAITDQNLAIVSDTPGTTTDPVSKAMELLPLGPVVIIDTPGLDDSGDLGSLRVEKASQVLNKTDIAVLVIDASLGLNEADIRILDKIKKKEIPFVLVKNKVDLYSTSDMPLHNDGIMDDIDDANIIEVSTKTGYHIMELKELIARQVPDATADKRIVGDLLSPSDFVLLVVPLDSAAPKGRLILPQQQTIRDILEAHAVPIVVPENQLADTLTVLGKDPALVITDSQIFGKVSADTPSDILLTSFSILFARYKGNLDVLSAGAKALDSLTEGSRILICEGCTHHRQCGDIGTVKLPKLLKNYTGKELCYSFTSGTEFPEDLSSYSLIIHCGGCMLNDKEMQYRLKCAEDLNVPMTNYGIAIAQMTGILARSLKPFSL